MVIVKKYGNRRLYDTTDSRYVTLGEIAAKIRGGADVRIVDAKSGDDLTPQMLTQIIFEDKDTARLLPVPLLVQLIRMGDDAVAEFFSRYVGWALDLYQQARQGLGAVQLNPFAPAAFSALNPLAALFGGAGRSAAPRPSGAASPSKGTSATTRDELAELRREIEELKKTVRKSRR